MSKIKILVTGGSGFIGTNLINKFSSKSVEIKNIDIKEPVDANQLKYWINCNILNYSKTKKIISDYLPDYIFHLAAKTDLDGKNISSYSVNTNGVKTIIGAVEKLNSLKYIFFFSTMLVLDTKKVIEDLFDYNPSTLYGQSKVIGEKLVIDSKLNNFIIIRPTSIWGPWFNAPYKSFFQIVSKGLFFGIKNNKIGKKTFGYVENLILFLEKVIERNNVSDFKKVYYYGDTYMSMNDFAKLILKDPLINKNYIQLPYIIFYLLSKFGDLLKLININFPMNSFRLTNIMTTNVIKKDCVYDHFKENNIKLKHAINTTIKFINDESIDKLH